jgi:FAD-dependent urate hydroxylase
MVDVVVIGAGPYGLSAAAHLRAVPGLEVRVFGDPMSFWRRDMPEGMLLRSPWDASHLSDPGGRFGLESYARSTDRPVSRPIPRDAFVEYGTWFQRNAAPGVEKRTVLAVNRERKGFRLTMEGGEIVRTARLVVAAGIKPFAWIPIPFRALPAEAACHTASLHDPQIYRGKQVVVIGAGQSALESAALLKEAGAGVEVIARRQVRFLKRSNWLHSLGPVTNLLYAASDVGPAGVSRVAAAPTFYRRLPRPVHDAWRLLATRPAGSAWLAPRLEGVTITCGVSVNLAEAGPEGLTLLLSDGSMRCVDHVILGTGYRVDISRYGFLPRGLVEEIRRAQGFPCLADGMESSVPGLHFLGAPAAWTFGPLLQFVAGTGFAARELTRCLAGREIRRMEAAA